jgi:hypothetical protein
VHEELCFFKCPPPQKAEEQGVCHSVALPFTLKIYLKAKEELWKLKYFTMQKYTFTLRSVLSLNNPQNREMKFCENMKLTC